MSLKTKDLGAARYLGASLTAKAADIILDDFSDVTLEQLSDLFLAVLAEHRRTLAILAAFSHAEPNFDPVVDARDETAMGWSYRLLSKKGVAARFEEADRKSFVLADLDAPTIAAVERGLARMQATGEAQPSRFRIEAAMSAAEIPLSAATMAKVEPVYLRALGDALLETRARYVDNPIDFEELTAKSRHEAQPVADVESDRAKTTDGFADHLANDGIRHSPQAGVGVLGQRLWKSIKYEEVYLRAYETVSHARISIGRSLDFYNRRRPHSSLGRTTPDKAYFNQQLLAAVQTRRSIHLSSRRGCSDKPSHL